MTKKKQKQHIQEKGQKVHKKGEAKNYAIEVSQMQSDVKSFIEKFKSDVARKREEYQSHAKKFLKKKKEQKK